MNRDFNKNDSFSEIYIDNNLYKGQTINGKLNGKGVIYFNIINIMNFLKEL